MTEALAKSLKECFPEIQLSVESADNLDEINIKIKLIDGDDVTLYPDNLYDVYVQNPNDYEDYRDNIIQNVGELLNPTDDETVLLPVIKTLDWMASINANTTDNGEYQDSSLVYMPLAGDLVIVFALDNSASMSYLLNDQLSDYCADGEINAIYQLAMNNFQCYLQNIEIKLDDMGYIVYVDGNYDPSLILKFEQWKHLIPLKGEPIIGVIARNQLVIADSQKSAQVSALKNYIKQEFDNLLYAISADLYTIKQDKLCIYTSH